MTVLIVNYHYFREYSSGRGIYPTSRASLLEDIDQISRAGYSFCGFNQIDIQKIYDTNKYCSITFDDGLKEQLSAFNLLNKIGVPSIYFVVTQTLDKLWPDVHLLHYLRAKYPDDQILDEALFELIDVHDIESISAKSYPYDTLQAAKFKYYFNVVLDSQKRAKLIASIYQKIGEILPPAHNYFMDESDLRLLASASSLGNHSQNHQNLAALSNSDLAQNIYSSQSRLNTVTGSFPTSFSFPYGGPRTTPKQTDEFYAQ